MHSINIIRSNRAAFGNVRSIIGMSNARARAAMLGHGALMVHIVQCLDCSTLGVSTTNRARMVDCSTECPRKLLKNQAPSTRSLNPMSM